LKRVNCAASGEQSLEPRPLHKAAAEFHNQPSRFTRVAAFCFMRRGSFAVARVLVCLDHAASFIVNANYSSGFRLSQYGDS
jgi:hypothetical protein